MTTKDLQCLLTYLKDGGGSFYKGRIDGLPGPLTKGAVESFQRRAGLPVTGEADEETWDAIRKAVAEGLPEQKQEDFWQEIQYFTPEEFRCKCGGLYCGGFPHPVQPLLVQLCDRARVWTGKPIEVVSGLRCPEWNKRQKGVANSQHMYGEAADLYFYGVSPNAALAWLKGQPEVRYAYRIEGSNNIHFDIPPVGR